MSKVNFGIQDVHVAKITETNGTITYGTPFPVKGAVSLNVDPEGGDATPFYADNIVYYMVPATNNGYSGDLELAITPEEFLTQILGQEIDDNDVIFESTDDKIARFALLFQAQGDDKNKRFCFYDCTAQRPSRTNSTKTEGVDVGTETISITMNPRTSDRIVKSFIEENEDNSTVYEGWFNQVYEKQTEGSGV